MKHDSQKLVLGIDIGGTKTAVVLGSARGEIRQRKQFPTKAERGFEPVFQEITGNIKEALASAKGKVVAISVSIGGPLEISRGVVKSPPHLPGWTDIPLKDLLSEEFRMPVYVEHDGNAGALAEFYFGAGRGCKNIIFITMGTGFGAGIIRRADIGSAVRFHYLVGGADHGQAGTPLGDGQGSKRRFIDAGMVMVASGRSYGYAAAGEIGTESSAG